MLTHPDKRVYKPRKKVEVLFICDAAMTMMVRPRERAVMECDCQSSSRAELLLLLRMSRNIRNAARARQFVHDSIKYSSLQETLIRKAV